MLLLIIIMRPTGQMICWILLFWIFQFAWIFRVYWVEIFFKWPIWRKINLEGNKRWGQSSWNGGVSTIEAKLTLTKTWKIVKERDKRKTVSHPWQFEKVQRSKGQRSLRLQFLTVKYMWELWKQGKQNSPNICPDW